MADLFLCRIRQEQKYQYKHKCTIPIVQELKKSQSNAENFYDPVLDAGGYNGGRCRIVGVATWK